MAEQSWEEYLKENCIGANCWVAGLLYTETGELFEVAAVDDNGWAHLYAEEEEREINGKKVLINETQILKELLDTGKVTNGLWFGGKKYQVVRTDKVPYKESEYQVSMFARGKVGGVVVKGETHSVVGLYDEERDQTKNGCLGVILEFCSLNN